MNKEKESLRDKFNKDVKKSSFENFNNKETLSNKEMKMNDIALHVFKKKDVKEFIKRCEKRINKTYCKDCGNNPMKIINEEAGEGLL